MTMKSATAILTVILVFTGFGAGLSQVEECTSTPPCPRKYFSYYCQAGGAINGCSPTPFGSNVCSHQCLYKPTGVVSSRYEVELEPIYSHIDPADPKPHCGKVANWWPNGDGGDFETGWGCGVFQLPSNFNYNKTAFLCLADCSGQVVIHDTLSSNSPIQYRASLSSYAVGYTGQSNKVSTIYSSNDTVAKLAVRPSPCCFPAHSSDPVCTGGATPGCELDFRYALGACRTVCRPFKAVGPYVLVTLNGNQFNQELLPGATAGIRLDHAPLPPTDYDFCQQLPPPTLPLRGRTGLQAYGDLYGGFGGPLADDNWENNNGELPFQVVFQSASFSFHNILYGRTARLLFGGWDDGPTGVNRGEILLGAGAEYFGYPLAVFAGVEMVDGEPVFRLRWEGHGKYTYPYPTGLQPDILYEATFFPRQRITITIGQHSRLDEAWGIREYNGPYLAHFPACQFCSFSLCSDAEGAAWAATPYVQYSAPPPAPPSPPLPPPPPSSMPPAPALTSCPVPVPPALGLLGRDGLQLLPNSAGDDSHGRLVWPGQPTPGFGVTFGDTEYAFTDIYWASNAYIGFGGASSDWYELPESIGYPSWLIGAQDGSSFAVYSGVETRNGEQVFRMRFEGHNSFNGGDASNPDIVYEVIFYAGERATIAVGPHSAVNRGIWQLDGRWMPGFNRVPSCEYCSISLCSVGQFELWIIAQV